GGICPVGAPEPLLADSRLAAPELGRPPVVVADQPLGVAGEDSRRQEVQGPRIQFDPPRPLIAQHDHAMIPTFVPRPCAFGTDPAGARGRRGALERAAPAPDPAAELVDGPDATFVPRPGRRRWSLCVGWDA